MKNRYFIVFYEGERVNGDIVKGIKNVEVIEGKYLNYQWVIQNIIMEERLVACVLTSPPLELSEEDYKIWTKDRIKK